MVLSDVSQLIKWTNHPALGPGVSPPVLKSVDTGEFIVTGVMMFAQFALRDAVISRGLTG